MFNDERGCWRKVDSYLAALIYAASRAVQVSKSHMNSSNRPGQTLQGKANPPFNMIAEALTNFDLSTRNLDLHTTS
jgi:hypothetical protein